jgi:hypothetical protein
VFPDQEANQYAPEPIIFLSAQAFNIPFRAIKTGLLMAFVKRVHSFMILALKGAKFR